MFNTKLKTPDFIKDAKDNKSVIDIDDISPNDVPYTIPSTPKKLQNKLEAEIISLDTPYCSQVIRVENKSTNVLFKYPFEGFIDHKKSYLDMTSNVIVGYGAKNI